MDRDLLLRSENNTWEIKKKYIYIYIYIYTYAWIMLKYLRIYEVIEAIWEKSERIPRDPLINFNNPTLEMRYDIGHMMR